MSRKIPDAMKWLAIIFLSLFTVGCSNSSSQHDLTIYKGLGATLDADAASFTAAAAASPSCKGVSVHVMDSSRLSDPFTGYRIYLTTSGSVEHSPEERDGYLLKKDSQPLHVRATFPILAQKMCSIVRGDGAEIN